MSALPPTQRWCGQTQPHNPHIWAPMPPPGSFTAMNAECAGHGEPIAAAWSEGFDAGVAAATSVPFGGTYRVPDNPYRADPDELHRDIAEDMSARWDQ